MLDDNIQKSEIWQHQVHSSVGNHGLELSCTSYAEGPPQFSTVLLWLASFVHMNCLWTCECASLSLWNSYEIVMEWSHSITENLKTYVGANSQRVFELKTKESGAHSIGEGK